jgi:hypothetical protein
MFRGEQSVRISVTESAADLPIKWPASIELQHNGSIQTQKTKHGKFHEWRIPAPRFSNAVRMANGEHVGD